MRVIAAPDGTLIDPVDIDLAEPDEAAGRSIEACLDGSQMNVSVDEYMSWGCVSPVAAAACGGPTPSVR